VDITQTVKPQNGLFCRRDYSMYVFYSFRECHYLKRKKIEVNPYYSLGLLQQAMISSADHHDLSVVCQAQAYQIVGGQNSGPLQLVGVGRVKRCGCTHRHPPALWACKTCNFPIRSNLYNSL